MLGTYVNAVVILVAATILGQTLFAACGRRQFSWLSPAVGLALLCPLAWGTVQLPGEGITSALITLAVLVACGLFLRGRVAARLPTARMALPVVLGALVLGSLPFFVAGRYGILGTGLNPDMSQHLFAADRLAQGTSERLADSGYPLGPHSIVVSATSGTGTNLVTGFDGLSLAVIVAMALAPLALLAPLGARRRTLGALLVGLSYMVSSYFIQGAFKEVMEALFVLAFAIGLQELSVGALTGRRGAKRLRTRAGLPLAALAIGAVYAYSFPGLFWLGGTLGVWALGQLAMTARDRSRPVAWASLRAARRPFLVGLAALAVVSAPEVSRMVNFASFETFDPRGPGLGNLFNRISPLEALGIWPSGDFRLDAGAGAVPAVGFWLAGALAVGVLAYGLWWWVRRRELAVPAALAAGAVLVLWALVGGTPYQEAKAIIIAAPLAMLVMVRALLAGPALNGVVRFVPARLRPAGARRPAPAGRLRLAGGLAAAAFLVAASGCSVLALANGPVGPADYSPGLADLRRGLDKNSTLVLAPRSMLSDEHGRDFLVWELRGLRVCVGPAGKALHAPPESGIAHVITIGATGPPFGGLRFVRSAGPYSLWDRDPAPGFSGPCPLIATGARANPAGD